MKQITVVIIVLTIFVTIPSFSMAYTITTAQQSNQCPVGQLPVYQEGNPVIDPATGRPMCHEIGPLDPLGSIFGR